MNLYILLRRPLIYLRDGRENADPFSALSTFLTQKQGTRESTRAVFVAIGSRESRHLYTSPDLAQHWNVI